MRRVVGLDSFAESLPRSVATIGKFLAVHRGHQALLLATVQAARREAVPSVVVTFDRHPLEVLRPGTRIPVIATLEERLERIAAEGIDVALVLPVTPELLALEPETFVREVLVRKLGAIEILAGGNFRFGRAARGNLELLRQLGAAEGFRVTEVPPVLEGGEPISSSRIAACVHAGRVKEAGLFLGRPFAVPGRVVRGDQVGRKLGFPTANVRCAGEVLLPSDGVYVARLERGAEALPAVANLGVRPTVDGTRRLLEVHALDWSGDLYDAEVRVQFLERIRSEERFPDLGALQAQIARDVDTARSFFRVDGSRSADP